MQQRRRQRERQKDNRFKRIVKATTLHVHHAFLYIFLAITALPGQENAKFHILLRT